MAISKQANLDGTLVDDQDPSHPATQDRENILKSALSGNGYILKNFSRQSYPSSHFIKFIAEIEKGQINLELEIFYFANFASSGRSRSHEKRIQISHDWSSHSTEFALSKSGKKRCLLIGTYTRNNQTIFGAWDAAAYLNHGQNVSCYVSVEAIASAMRDGFGLSINEKNRLVCCFRPEFMHFYINNMELLHEPSSSTLGIQQQLVTTENSNLQELLLSTDTNVIPIELPRNRVIFGAPGTGKSYKLEEEATKFFPHPALRTRVTFYPDYSYPQFIGSYRPTPVYRDSNETLYESDKITQVPDSKLPLVDYRYVPGTLLQMYCRAIQNPSHNFLIIIEELNRTDAAAAFGDWFQLLDRNAMGESEFTIATSPDLRAFLIGQGMTSDGIKLPSNLYIWATMNSSDQNVMPLDSAFKRRWSFDYVGLDDGASVVTGKNLSMPCAPGGLVEWNTFRGKLNTRLRHLGVTEDRLIGPFFLKHAELQDGKAIKNKLLMYLREDVVRHDPEKLFNAATFGEIVGLYDSGNNVFKDISF